MNIEDIHTFRLAAESNSFRKAADELLLSQPAVSQRIRQLEHQLNVRLFDRKGRRVTLAPAGSVLLAFAQDMDARVQDLRDSLAKLESEEFGVTIGTPAGAATWILPELLAEFRRHAPELNTRVSILSRDEIRVRLARRTLDFGVLYGADARGTGLVAHSLPEMPLVLCAAPDHPLTELQDPSPGTIASYPFVAASRSTLSRDYLHSWARANDVEVHVQMEVDSYESMAAAVRAGMGIAFLAEPSAAEPVHTGALSVVPAPPPRLVLQPHLVVSRAPATESAAGRFMAVAADEAWRCRIPRLRNTTVPS